MESSEYEKSWKGYLENTHDKLVKILLPDLSEKDTILDVSCGTGMLASHLIKREAPFRELVMNDISSNMLKTAQSRLPSDPRLTFSIQPAENLEFGTNRFTRIICLNAFHNYDQPTVVLNQFKRILTPDGKLYLLDWNRTGWFRLINTLIRWTGRETINTFNLQEITYLLEKFEFNILYTDQWNYR